MHSYVTIHISDDTLSSLEASSTEKGKHSKVEYKNYTQQVTYL